MLPLSIGYASDIRTAINVVVFVFLFFAKHIIMRLLFRNIHPSLQYFSRSCIHTSLYDFCSSHLHPAL